MNNRKGRFMQTYSRTKIWPLDPRGDEIRIEDIAHALSHQCRFGGHCDEFYSVAQHCILVSRMLGPEHKLAGLLHDASEAYLIDLPSPVKNGMKEYQYYEDQMMEVVALKFGFEWPLPKEVVDADKYVLAIEKEQLMKSNIEWTEDNVPNLMGINVKEKYPITPLKSGDAKLLFLSEYLHIIENENR